MEEVQKYDVAIIGGGLAGLAASIELSRKGYSVVLFEKEAYPFHKVCGEYVSMESRDYLESLGLPLDEMQLPLIKNFLLTSPSGRSFKTALPLGGFGISRYLLDDELAQIAKNNGVDLREGTKVESAEFRENEFEITVISPSGKYAVNAKLCFVAHGKRSNLDIKWKRKFITAINKRTDNYVAVKYHVKTDAPSDQIALHNFRNGYCGISGIEKGKYCLCYMVRAEEFSNAGNSITQLEQNLLSKNPFLKTIFHDAEILSDFPVTISQISFRDKERVEDHRIMLGDAAGMITPLCGNGMSIALHTAKLAAASADLFLQGKISRESFEKKYDLQWKENFAKRLAAGRTLQKFFGSEASGDLFVGFLKLFPFFAKPLIRLTHGKPF